MRASFRFSRDGQCNPLRAFVLARFDGPEKYAENHAWNVTVRLYCKA